MTTETTETTETPSAPAPETPATPPAPDAPLPAETPEQIAAKAREDRLARATRAEQAAAEGREMRRARAERERVNADRHRLDADRRAYEQRQAEEAEAIRKGGLPALKARGLDYASLTKEWIDESTPEGKERAQLAREQAELKKQIAELTQVQQNQRVEQAFAALGRTLETHAEKYPHAYAMSERMFRAAVPAIAQMLISQGRQPTESLVLKTLDEAEKSEHDERETRRSALQKRIGTKPSNGATQQSSSSNATRATRTLTSQDGSERAAERGRKTDAELDEEIARVIAPMLREE